MNFLAPATLVLFLFFVIPGFVSIKVYDLLVPSERRNFGNSIIEVIGFSIINLLPWSPIFAFTDFVDARSIRRLSRLRFDLSFLEYATLLGVLFVSPVLLTVVYYVFLSSPRTRRALKLPPRAPTGWDHFFGKREKCWILFHLKSGQKVGGLYGSESSASTFPHVQQVYVQSLYRVDPEGNWTLVSRTKGAIINREDCDLIELLQPQPGPGE